jgi:uncharacterized protein YqgC (DUF456 family)
MTILAGIIVILASLAGIALTLVMMPGIWLTIGVALLCQWLLSGEENLFAWTTLGAAVAMGAAGELFEVIASALGAARAGGTRRGAVGSIIGAVAGAVVGSMVLFFPIGTIVGGAVGAGLGALVAERHGGRRTWAESARVGGGAAAGRLVATLFKAVMAVAVGVVLSVAVFVR